MNKRVRAATKNRNQLVKALVHQTAKAATQVAGFIKDEQRDMYARTTKHWNASGINKFPKPIPEFDIKVIEEADRVTLIVRSYMKGGGVISPLWYWLDGGTRSRIQRNTSPPIRERVSTRTKIGDLDSNPFPGFTGRRFVIRKGRPVRGIPAREWSETIGKKTDEALKATPEKARGFKVVKRSVKRG